jgi:uncharacterized membrane protein
MFIIIIVVIGIIIYLSTLHNRVNHLENRLNNLNFNSSPVKTETTVEMIESDAPESFTEKPEPVVLEEVKPHQDNFARNLSRFGITILVLGVLFFLNYIDSQGLIGPVFKYISGLLFGVILLSIAEYLKQKNKVHTNYINILRGGSFVIFFLTLFYS